MTSPIVGFTGPASNRGLYGITDPSKFRRGGIGIVYEALLLDDHLGFAAGTKVGLKLLTGVDADRFAKLSSRTAVLREHPHPSLARVIESFVGPPLAPEVLGEEDATLYFSVHEWVEGDALSSLVEQASEEQILGWMADIARGIDHLHDLPGGFAHRDVHARNIIVRPDGTACLIDFDTILWGEGHDTVLTSLHSAPRLLQAAGTATGQAQDRSMVALTLLRALARDSDGASALSDLARDSLTHLRGSETETKVGSVASDTVVGFLLRAIRQPPPRALDIVTGAHSHLSQRPRRRSRLDPERELALLEPGAAARKRRRTRGVVWASVIAAAVAVGLVVTVVLSASSRPPIRPEDHVLRPAFQCWNGTKVFRLSQCSAPSGLAGIRWTFPGAVTLRAESCSPQGGLNLSFCSFASIGMRPVPGVWNEVNSNIGGGITFIGPDNPSTATVGLSKQKCSHVCSPWIVDGELAGRIDVEHASSLPDHNSWLVSDGPANLTRVVVAYQHYSMALDFFVTDLKAVPALLKALRPRPPSQMRGFAVPGPDAYPCWNGVSALSLGGCSRISGVDGLLWSLPSLTGRVSNCESVASIGPAWACLPSDIGFGGAAATDIHATNSIGDQRFGIQVGIWDSGDSGASQIVTQPGVRVVREPWMVDGKQIGTLVWSYPKVSGGKLTVDAGYAKTPVWIRVTASRRASIEALLRYLNPQPALTPTG